MQLKKWWLAVTVLIAFAGCSAWSQSYATINGSVTDPAGQSITGAKVVVTNMAKHGLPLDTLWRFSIARALTDVIAAVVLLPLMLLLRRWGSNGDLSAH